MTSLRFAGRSVLVTGGCSGIGRATAMAFAREGAAVVIGDIDQSGASSLLEEIAREGGRALFCQADATDERSVEALLAFAADRHGPVEHAFNNVGRAGRGAIEDMTREAWDETIAISLTSTWLAMKHELPGMLARGRGTIVNTASMSGKIFTAVADPAYSAAKAGVVHLSHYAGATYGARGVRINSVSPGLTATPVIARKLTLADQAEAAQQLQAIPRAVAPEEIAAAVLFLSSDEAGMVNGTNLEVNGGRR